MLLVAGSLLLVALRATSKPAEWGAGPLDIIFRMLPHPWWRVLLSIVALKISILGLTAVWTP